MEPNDEQFFNDLVLSPPPEPLFEKEELLPPSPPPPPPKTATRLSSKRKRPPGRPSTADRSNDVPVVDGTPQVKHLRSYEVACSSEGDKGFKDWVDGLVSSRVSLERLVLVRASISFARPRNEYLFTLCPSSDGKGSHLSAFSAVCRCEFFYVCDPPGLQRIHFGEVWVRVWVVVPEGNMVRTQEGMRDFDGFFNAVTPLFYDSEGACVCYYAWEFPFDLRKHLSEKSSFSDTQTFKFVLNGMGQRSSEMAAKHVHTRLLDKRFVETGLC